MQFTKEDFLSWLKQQPLDRQFDYLDVHDCLLAAFIKEGMGLEDITCGSDRYTVYGGAQNIFVPFPAWALELGHKLAALPTYFTVREALEAI